MRGYLVVYERPNSKIEYKTLCHKPQLKVGQSNQYGWKVIDIKILNKGKALTEEQYKKELYKSNRFRNIVYLVDNINIMKLLEFSFLLLLLYFFTH